VWATPSGDANLRWRVPGVLDGVVAHEAALPKPGMLHAMAVWESPLLRFRCAGWRGLRWLLVTGFPVWSMALSHRNPGW